MNRRPAMYAIALSALLTAGFAHAQPPAVAHADSGTSPQALGQCPYDPAGAIYVDDDNAGGMQDGTPDNPYATIQQAIDAADPNAVIVVRAGDYFENLDVHEPVQLIGAGADQALVHGCDPNGAYVPDIVSVRAPNVRMCGFGIYGCGIDTSGALVSVEEDRFAMRACKLADGDYLGVRVEGVEDCRIESSSIIDLPIVVENASHNSILDNEVTGPGANVALYNGASDNVVRGNTLSGCDYYAITIQSDATGNLIEENYIHDNRNAIRARECGNNTISNNTFADNRFDGISLSETVGMTIRDNHFAAGGGILFSFLDRVSVHWNTHTITGNTVEGAPIYYYNGANGVTVPADAAQVILTNCANVTVAGLQLDKAASPIQVGYSSYVSVADNHIASDWYAAGILMVGSQHSVISGNTLECTYTRYQYGQTSGIEAIDIEDGTDDAIAGNTIIGFNQGIMYRSWQPTSNTQIRDNDVTSWNESIFLHSYTDAVTNTTISRNHIAGGVFAGLYAGNWPGLSVTDNTFVNSGLRLTSGDPNEWRTYEITGNTVNDNPLYYFHDEHDLVTPSDAGQMILYDCDNATVSGLHIASASVGIIAAFCQGGAISGNQIDGVGHTGILLNNSPNLHCVDNDVHGYQQNIQANRKSDGAVIAGNRVGRSTGASINAGGSTGVVIDGNLIEGLDEDAEGPSGSGIHLAHIAESTISNNTIRCLDRIGIITDESTENLIVGNSIAKCGTAVLLTYKSNDNQIYGNQFIDSSHVSASEIRSVDDNSWTGPDGGNYWSDFETNPGYPDYYVIIDSEADDYVEVARDTAPLPERIRAPYACGDINESCGPVNIADLGEFLACFSQQPTDDCTNADLDGDGAIDMTDLGLLLHAFGDSPDCEPPDCAVCAGG